MPASTSRLALPYPIPDDTVDVPRDVLALATKLDGLTSIQPAVVTSLPSGPPIGTEVYYQASATVLWHLRFDGTQWNVLGGDPLLDEIATAESTASITYVNLATLGPQVLCPLAGVYWAEVAAQLSTAAIAGNSAYVSPSVNGGSASDQYCYNIGTGSAVAIAGRGSSGPSRWSVTAGQYIRVMYRASATGNGTITAQRRALAVMPARIYAV